MDDYYDDYFDKNCPAPMDDYDACCMCLFHYYYSCECCTAWVEKYGVDPTVCMAMRPDSFPPGATDYCTI